jgi:hypothetical protein
VERLDGIDGQVVAGRDLGVGGQERSVLVREGEIGPRLHGQHRRQTDHPGQQGRPRGGHAGAVPRQPAQGFARQGLRPRRDRLVGHPPFDILGQRPAGGVAILGLQGHRFPANGFQGLVDRRVEPRGRGELTPLDLAEDFADVVAFIRRLAGQEAKEGRAERIHVAPRAQQVEVAAGLLRAHVGRRAQGAAGQRLGAATGRGGHERAFAGAGAGLGPAQRLGQPPVHDQRLAVLADDHIARLDVTVQHAARVRVLDGVTHVGEPLQQLAQLQRAAPRLLFQRLIGVEVLDGHFEAVALDEPHRVIGTAAGIGAQPVNRDNSGVLQPAGDLGFHEEPLPAGRVVGVLVEDLLESDLAVQFLIQRHEHRPEPAAGVRPEDAEPQAVAGRRADGVGGREVGIARRCRAVPGGHMAERPLDIRVAEPGQTFARRLAGRHSGEAFFDVAVLLDVQGDHRVQAGAGVNVEVTPGDELVGQALGLVAGPGLEGKDELALVDQAVLKREQSEQEMAVRGGGHGGAPIVVGRSGEGRRRCLLRMSSHPILLIVPSPSRGTTLAAAFPEGSLVAVGADDFAIGPGAEGPPRGLVDRILGEPDAAVGHKYVHAAWVIAPGLGKLALVVLARGVGAPGPRIHLGVRRRHGVSVKPRRPAC